MNYTTLNSGRDDSAKYYKKTVEEIDALFQLLSKDTWRLTYHITKRPVDFQLTSRTSVGKDELGKAQRGEVFRKLGLS